MALAAATGTRDRPSGLHGRITEHDCDCERLIDERWCLSRRSCALQLPARYLCDSDVLSIMSHRMCCQLCPIRLLGHRAQTSWSYPLTIRVCVAFNTSDKKRWISWNSA